MKYDYILIFGYFLALNKKTHGIRLFL